MTPGSERGDVSGRTPSDEAVEREWTVAQCPHGHVTAVRGPSIARCATCGTTSLGAVLVAAFPSGEQPGGEEADTQITEDRLMALRQLLDREGAPTHDEAGRKLNFVGRTDDLIRNLRASEYRRAISDVVEALRTRFYTNWPDAADFIERRFTPTSEGEADGR